MRDVRACEAPCVQPSHSCGVLGSHQGRRKESLYDPKDAVLTSDRQLQDYLLCDACELILSEGGENYLLPLLARQGHKFPLYDLLKVHAQNEKLAEGMEIFNVLDNSPIQGKKIAHFALGIFWKASAHAWKLSGGDLQIDLGEHKEELRRFLAGEIRWSDAPLSLLVWVSKPEQLPMLRIMAPGPFGDYPAVTAFRFEVPGMAFVLKTGPGMTREDMGMSFGSAPDHPIIVHDAMSQLAVLKNLQRVNEVRQTASFLRAEDRRKATKPDRK